MKPLIVARQDIAGGAARAASRLALALRNHGTDAEMLTTSKASDYSWVLGKRSFGRELKATLRSHTAAKILRLQKQQDVNSRSLNSLPTRLDRTINALPHDVVNLHWVGGETLSNAAISRIRKPVVWTLHDMWAFCGAEHYTTDEPDSRWRTGYHADNRLPGESGIDMDRYCWNRKRAAWRTPQTVIATSNWLARCARDSVLMRDWPVHVIFNPLDLNTFRPWPKALARQMLGLPEDRLLIGFGAMGGTRDPRKGWDLLERALRTAAQASVAFDAVIFGQSAPATPQSLPVQTHWTGHINDDIALALLYSAIDVIVVPSRQDSLPQTATEPQACGVPVIAFDTCGLPDVVEHGVTGMLVPAFDTDAFAHGIVKLLTDTDLRARMGAASRDRMERLMAPDTIAAQYQAVYETVVRG